MVTYMGWKAPGDLCTGQQACVDSCRGYQSGGNHRVDMV